MNELEYMQREFKKLERQLLGATKSSSSISNDGSKARREKLHSFIVHLEETMKQITMGCSLEAKGVLLDTPNLNESALTSKLTKEKQQEENVQKLEEHILANLLPVKVRLTKQLAAQQGASRNPVGMPVRRNNSSGANPHDTTPEKNKKGTFAEAVEERKKRQQQKQEQQQQKKQMESWSAAASASNIKSSAIILSTPSSRIGKTTHPVAAPATATTTSQISTVAIASPTGKSKKTQYSTVPKTGSSLTKKLQGATPVKTQPLYAGMTPGSAQMSSSLLAASGVHDMVLVNPNFQKIMVQSQSQAQSHSQAQHPPPPPPPPPPPLPTLPQTVGSSTASSHPPTTHIAPSPSSAPVRITTSAKTSNSILPPPLPHRLPPPPSQQLQQQQQQQHPTRPILQSQSQQQHPPRPILQSQQHNNSNIVVPSPQIPMKMTPPPSSQPTKIKTIPHQKPNAINIMPPPLPPQHLPSSNTTPTKKTLKDPNLTEEERQILLQKRRRKRKQRKLLLKQQQQQQQQQQHFMYHPNNNITKHPYTVMPPHTSATIIPGNNRGMNHHSVMQQQQQSYPKKGPRSVEYTCALCNETYPSISEFNPWWALISHDCGKCGKTQIPRIDISSPANSIDYHPALLAHSDDCNNNNSTNKSNLFSCNGQIYKPPPHHLPVPPPMYPPPPPATNAPTMIPMHQTGTKLSPAKYPGKYNQDDWSDDDDLDLDDDELDLDSDDDATTILPLSAISKAENEDFGKIYDGPEFSKLDASRLLILMRHASTCPGRYVFLVYVFPF